MSDRSTAEPRGTVRKRTLGLRLDEFAWEALQHESTRLKVSEEELVAYAVLYYLADVDSGRIARRIPPRPAADRSK